MGPDIIGLLILAVCVVLFLTEWLPLAATGCLGCLLMVLLGVGSFDTIFSGFSNSIVLLMASTMIVGIAMFQTGAAQIIGRAIIRWSKGNERLFLAVSCVVTGLASLFLANTALLSAYIPIIDSVCSSSETMKRRNLTLPISCAIMFGGASTLVGCTPQLTADGLMSKMVGQEMGMWTLTGPGLCLFALFLVFALTWGYHRSRKLWGGRPEADMGLDHTQHQDGPQTPGAKRRLCIMFVIIALMILSYALSLLPTAETAMCAAMLCVLTGCCKVSDIVRKLHWESVVFLAACLGLAEGLTTAGSGELIGNAVSSALGSVTSPMVIFAVLTFLTLFISQFITNSTALIIVLPVAFSLCEQYGFQCMPFCVGITLAASIACCTPLAAAQITMTQVAGYEFSDYLKYSWPLSLLGYAGILLFVPLFYPLV